MIDLKKIKMTTWIIVFGLVLDLIGSVVLVGAFEIDDSGARINVVEVGGEVVSESFPVKFDPKTLQRGMLLLIIGFVVQGIGLVWNDIKKREVRLKRK